MSTSTETAPAWRPTVGARALVAVPMWTSRGYDSDPLRAGDVVTVREPADYAGDHWCETEDGRTHYVAARHLRPAPGPSFGATVTTTDAPRHVITADHVRAVVRHHESDAYKVGKVGPAFLLLHPDGSVTGHTGSAWQGEQEHPGAEAVTDALRAWADHDGDAEAAAEWLTRMSTLLIVAA